jgi:4-hydroxy-tetrahydrodipicolinate synthase
MTAAAFDEPGRWHGVFPYLVTPLDDDGNVRTAVLGELVRRVLAAGVHGVTPLGSTGEFPYLSPRARREAIVATVEAVAGQVPVVAGVGGFTVAEAVEQARFAAEAGVDGLLLILQAYYPLDDAEVEAYVRAVAAATGLPICLYHHPGFCHVTMSPALVARLAQIPGVDYLKDASGGLALFVRSPELAEQGMRLFAATAGSPAAAMLLGAVGWMSGPACVFPGESVRMYELARAGRWDDAVRVERALSAVLGRFRTLGPSASVKALLRADGLDVGVPVPPVADRAPEDAAAVLARARRELAAVLDALAA